MAYDKVVDSAVLDGYFEDIADAIRDKGGSGTFTPAQMPDEIAALPSGGNDPDLIALMAGTATGSVTIRNVTDMDSCRICLGKGFSSGGSGITELHMPDLEFFCSSYSSYIAMTGGLVDVTGTSSASDTAKLEVLDIPKCKTLFIGPVGSPSAAGYYFANLRTLNAPKLEKFSGALVHTQLTELDLPELVEARGLWAFTNNTHLARVSVPKLLTCGQAAFKGCSALTSFSAPVLTRAETEAFRDCTSLTDVRFPSYTDAVTSGLFNTCTALEVADMYKASQVANLAFKACAALKALVLRNTTLVSLQQTYAFTGSGVEAGTGYIYVPRDLIATYQAATNWVTFATQFRALEDYTDDGTLSGEFILPAN